MARGSWLVGARGRDKVHGSWLMARRGTGTRGRGLETGDGRPQRAQRKVKDGDRRFAFDTSMIRY